MKKWWEQTFQESPFLKGLGSKSTVAITTFWVAAYHTVLDIWGGDGGGVDASSTSAKVGFITSVLFAFCVIVLSVFVERTLEKLNRNEVKDLKAQLAKARKDLKDGLEAAKKKHEEEIEELEEEQFAATHKAISIMESVEAYSDFLEKFNIMTSSFVEHKINRFRLAIPKLDSESNVFEEITQPTNQIKFILHEVSAMLTEMFGIKEGGVSITIMYDKQTKARRGKREWGYWLSSNDNQKHASVKDLLTKSSAAMQAIKEGEVIFFPSKIEAERKGAYVFSKRDEAFENTGSIFCYPITIEHHNDLQDNYLISISTYGEQVCEAEDLDSYNIFKKFLSKVCKRIELEVTLKSIKEQNEKRELVRT